MTPAKRSPIVVRLERRLFVFMATLMFVSGGVLLGVGALHESWARVG